MHTQPHTHTQTTHQSLDQHGLVPIPDRNGPAPFNCHTNRHRLLDQLPPIAGTDYQSLDQPPLTVGRHHPLYVLPNCQNLPRLSETTFRALALFLYFLQVIGPLISKCKSSLLNTSRLKSLLKHRHFILGRLRRQENCAIKKLVSLFVERSHSVWKSDEVCVLWAFSGFFCCVPLKVTLIDWYVRREFAPNAFGG